jgi:hypothetical protein
MSEIAFAVTEVTPVPYAAAPTLAFRLHLEAPAGETIHSIALRCQIRIEPQRRRYSAEEEAGLLELFGETPRWGDTLKPFLWTHASAMVLGFTGTTGVDLHVPCTYDLDVAGAKGEGGALRVTQIPWDKEARYRLPVRVWRELIDRYFPNAGWLRFRRDTLDALLRVKARRALVTWDDVLAELLRAAGEEAA